MIKLITNVPCTKCSYYYVVEAVNNNSEYMRLVPVTFSVGKLNINEAYWFLRSYKHHVDDTDIVLWLDSPHVMDDSITDYKAKILITSNWTAGELQKHGVHVDGVLPYPIDERTALNYVDEEKKYDFVMIGGNIRTNDPKWLSLRGLTYTDGKNEIVIDRKGVRLFRRVKGKKVLVSNDTFADYKLFTLTQNEKYKLLAQSRFYLALSHSEGLGLPPLEAMAVGTVPLYVACHSYAEYLTGLYVRCGGREEVDTPLGKHWFYFYDEREVLELVDYAMGMGKEEYEDLRQKVLTASHKFYTSEVEERLIPYLSTVISSLKSTPST